MTTINLSATVPNALDQQRLDRACAALFPEYSREQLKLWIRAGHLTLNEAIVTQPRTKVHADQQIVICAELTPREVWEAQPLPLKVIYDDDDLLVIDKPAGLVVHPGAGNPDQTLVNALLHHYPELSALPRAGIIHRLDKDTTGLLVVARTLSAHHALTQAMQAREISRHYLALVQGTVISGGTIDAPLGRHPTSRTRMSVVNNGRSAITHYRIREKFRFHTLLDVKLETGRTHQIRVHLAHIRHPLVGDPTYCRNPHVPAGLPDDAKEQLKNFKRQALHAYQLTLMHPKTQETKTFRAPLPEDFEKLLNILQ